MLGVDRNKTFWKSPTLPRIAREEGGQGYIYGLKSFASSVPMVGANGGCQWGTSWVPVGYLLGTGWVLVWHQSETL